MSGREYARAVAFSGPYRRLFFVLWVPAMTTEPIAPLVAVVVWAVAVIELRAAVS